jgi:hypothetical protein
MKKKIISILVVVIMALSSLGAVAINDNSDNEEKMVSIFQSFSPYVINQFDNEYIDLTLESTSSYVMEPGKPVLPKIIKSVELPFGVSNIKVKVTPNNINEQKVDGVIRPAPEFLPLTAISSDITFENQKDNVVYSSNEPFPYYWYDYNVGVGRNEDNEIVTHLTIQSYPIRYIPAKEIALTAESFDIKITYKDPGLNPFPLNSEYDMVIIAPEKFSSDLQKLINHKNNLDSPITTTLKTTEDIYDNFTGDDKPEKIKYFIKDAIETWGVKYVLLVGGLKSLIWGNPRDDSNQGSEDWLVPVRYTNIYDNPKFPLADDVVHDPGVISDLYYADVYREGGVFEDWDPNDDGMICSWGKPGYVNDTGIDWYPDVALGRLACRNNIEVRIMVDKIINHETNAYGKDWFNRMIVTSGDGFLDQHDLDIQWDTNNLSEGDYIIYAQSNNPDEVYGPVDEIQLTIDRSQPSNITFNHDDHLKFDSYPYLPIAEITSPSNGNILGNTDYFENISDKYAYCNAFLGWANINFTDGIMHIRGKSYDPQPYGVETDIRVWINNSYGVKVFEQTVEGNEMYYEGEWVTGERLLKGEGGALYYMPGFDKEILWSSNGKWTGEEDFKNAFDQGSGFTFVSGHGAPTTWGNHHDGIPGNRKNSHLDGIQIIDWDGFPFFPMESLKNKYKTPVCLVGGCHNSQFNVSFIATLLNHPAMWTHGGIAPECWGWWFARVSKRASIATIGNTGLGYGVIGKDCTSSGLDGGICIEFFKQYNAGFNILGDTYMQTQLSYVDNFDMSLQEHGKSLSQWVLLGDPSLKIGGYETESQDISINIEGEGINADSTPGGSIEFQANTNQDTPENYEWSFDTTGDGIYDTFRNGKTIDNLTWEQPGVYWIKVKAIYPDHEETTETIVDVEQTEFPEIPAKPTGKTNIIGGIPYSYTTSSTDPYGFDLYYIFDWDDGTYSWIGPKKSGEIVSDTHIWKEKGQYEVKVMVVDTQAFWSEWSESLVVSVNKNKELNGQLLQELLQRFFELHPNTFPILKLLLNQ